MSIQNSFFNIKTKDHKTLLLYRFHITVIFVNIFAVIIDLFKEHYLNGSIEFLVAVLLSLNTFYLRRNLNVTNSAYIFLFVTSTALLSLLYINNFASISIMFVLLLPLTTLLFIRFRISLIITIFLFLMMAVLLYIESLTNESNLLVQNSTALFNLGYAALIIYAFSFLYHLSIIKTFDDLDASNRHAELLLKEVHHRVKNNLNIISSIIGLQAHRTEGKEKQLLQLTKARIESMSMVHEMLYKYDDFDKIDTQVYMEQLSNLLLDMFCDDKNIDIQINTHKLNAPLEIMLQLGIIINELVTNSLKYAFEGSKGRINIDFTEKENTYTFMYSDDGIGVVEPENIMKKNTLGIKLIYLCVKQLNATVSLTSPKGLRYIIEFTKK